MTARMAINNSYLQILNAVKLSLTLTQMFVQYHNLTKDNNDMKLLRLDDTLLSRCGRKTDIQGEERNIWYQLNLMINSTLPVQITVLLNVFNNVRGSVCRGAHKRGDDIPNSTTSTGTRYDSYWDRAWYEAWCEWITPYHPDPHLWMSDSDLGSGTELQGLIPCDTSGTWRSKLELGRYNNYHLFARGTLKSMYYFTWVM